MLSKQYYREEQKGIAGISRQGAEHAKNTEENLGELGAFA
jgi:hypothetical protein